MYRGEANTFLGHDDYFEINDYSIRVVLGASMWIKVLSCHVSIPPCIRFNSGNLGALSFVRITRNSNSCRSPRPALRYSGLNGIVWMDLVIA